MVALGSAKVGGVYIFYARRQGVIMSERLKLHNRLDHELRSLAHIVDMHQLTKDPDRLLTRSVDTKSSPIIGMSVYDMGRYLDYCSKMLSLFGKIAATYGLYWHDEIAIKAVNDGEVSTSEPL